MPALPAGGPAALAVAAAAAAAPLPVGAAPPGVFPDDFAVDAMSHGELQVLSIVYNETFDILAGDSLAQRRDKFRDWLSW
jgi:hypothetical protein